MKVKLYITLLYRYAVSQSVASERCMVEAIALVQVLTWYEDIKMRRLKPYSSILTIICNSCAGQKKADKEGNKCLST